MQFVRIINALKIDADCDQTIGRQIREITYRSWTQSTRANTDQHRQGNSHEIGIFQTLEPTELKLSSYEIFLW